MERRRGRWWMAGAFVLLLLVAAATRLALAPTPGVDGPASAQANAAPTAGVGDHEARRRVRGGASGAPDKAAPVSADDHARRHPRICGVVVSVRNAQTGAAIPDAHVEVVAEEGVRREGTTDAEGALLFDDLPWGGATVAATADGHTYTSVSIDTLPLGGSTRVVLRLDATCTLPVVVRDAWTRAPVAEATVRALLLTRPDPFGPAWDNPRPCIGTAQTNADGRADVPGVPGRWTSNGVCRLFVEVDGKGLETSRVEVGRDARPSTQAPLLVWTAPGGEIAGHVRDAAGAPISGVTVEILPPTGPPAFDAATSSGERDAVRRAVVFSSRTECPTLRTVTDATGAYRIAGLRIATTLCVVARAPTGLRDAVTPVRVPTTERFLTRDLVMRVQPAEPDDGEDAVGFDPPELGTAVIRGLVSYEDGAPAPGVRVRIDGSPHGCDTADDGTYAVRGLPEGEYKVRIWEGAHVIAETPCAAPGSAPPLVIARPPRPAVGRTRVRLVTAAGGVELPPYVFFEVEGTFGAVHTSAERDGRCVTLDLPALGGRGPLTLRPSGFLPLVVPAGPAVDGLYDAGEFVLDPGRMIRGRVVDDRGEPLAAGQVVARANRERQWALIARDGSFVVTGIGSPVGTRWTVSASAPGHENGRDIDIELGPGEPGDVTLRLVRLARLRVHVRSEAGIPVPDADVRDGPSIVGRTDRAGDVEIERRAGHVRVAARDPNSGRISPTMELDVERGATREVVLTIPEP